MVTPLYQLHNGIYKFPHFLFKTLTVMNINMHMYVTAKLHII